MRRYQRVAYSKGTVNIKRSRNKQKTAIRDPLRAKVLADLVQLLEANGSQQREVVALVEGISSAPLERRSTFAFRLENGDVKIDVGALNIHVKVTSSSARRHLKYKVPPDIIPPK